MEDLPEPPRNEISHFFSIDKQLEDSTWTSTAGFSHDEAIEVIDEAQGRYREDGRGGAGSGALEDA